MRILLLRSLHTAWDCFRPMRVAVLRGVVVLPRTLLLLWTVSDMLETGFGRPPLSQTRQRVQRHVLQRVPGIGLGLATPDCRAQPAVPSGTTVQLRTLNQLIGRLGPVAVLSLRNGYGSAVRAVHQGPCPAGTMHRCCRRRSARCVGVGSLETVRGPSAGFGESRRGGGSG